MYGGDSGELLPRATAVNALARSVFGAVQFPSRYKIKFMQYRTASFRFRFEERRLGLDNKLESCNLWEEKKLRYLIPGSISILSLALENM